MIRGDFFSGFFFTLSPSENSIKGRRSRGDLFFAIELARN